MTNARFHAVPVSPCAPQNFLNHILLIDVSKSMTEPDWPPSRMVAAFDATVAYVAQLITDAPSSAIAVVCFSETAYGLCQWTDVVSLRDLSTLHDEWLRASYDHGLRNTNIGDGLQEALLLAVARKGPTQVVLLTDGHHNTSVSPVRVAERLQALATIVVVGIGGAPTDVDERLLQRVASLGADGRPCYRWIGERAELVAHFERLAGRLTRE